MNHIQSKLIEGYGKIKHISHLNYGGCLIAAYAVYKYCKRDSSINVVQLDYVGNGSFLLHNRRFAAGLEDMATSGNHFALTCDGGKTVYDSNGPERDREVLSSMLLIPNHLTDAFCSSSLSRGNWCGSFDREKSVPEIESILNIKLFD